MKKLVILDLKDMKNITVSYTTQSGFELKENKLWLSKLGEIEIKLHRDIEGEIQRINIRKKNQPINDSLFSS